MPPPGTLDRHSLRHTAWLLFSLAGLFVLVWQAPSLRALQGVAVMPLWVHILLETFSIVVAMLVFGIVWNSYSEERPGNILILACALLAVGLIDFAHMLSFKGMPDFITPAGPEKGLNFWLSARLIAALALLAVALRPWRPLSGRSARYGLLAASLAVTAAIYWLGLFYEQAWPHTFVEGQGLTPFKIGAEYGIIAILLIPAVSFCVKARRAPPFDAASLFAATAVTILSELCFTLYSEVTDVMNLLGHIYKIAADLFIYRAAFVSSVREPFERLRESSIKSLEQERMLVLQSRHAAMGEMIGNIAHQWRQPLNALNVLLANLQDAYAFNELNREEMERCVSRGRHLTQKMSDTIDDFRNFFRPAKEKARFSLKQTLAETLRLIGASLQDNKVALIVEGEDDALAYGFPNEYAQVLANIINNAKDAIVSRKIANGELRVRIARQAGSAVMAVRDNGGGIPEDALPRVFDAYFTTKKQGTGIGLYMSRLIIENNMGGKITARNVEDGAEFIITCPLAPDSAPPAGGGS